jgi:hypothetical protein
LAIQDCYNTISGLCLKENLKQELSEYNIFQAKTAIITHSPVDLGSKIITSFPVPPKKLERRHSLGLIKTPLSSRFCLMPYGRHVKDERK